jgi:hypothetical protein
MRVRYQQGKVAAGVPLGETYSLRYPFSRDQSVGDPTSFASTTRSMSHRTCGCVPHKWRGPLCEPSPHKRDERCGGRRIRGETEVGSDSEVRYSQMCEPHRWSAPGCLSQRPIDCCLRSSRRRTARPPPSWLLAPLPPGGHATDNFTFVGQTGTADTCLLLRPAGSKRRQRK